jgi:tetratricopeptide (TPR) repeat protein
MQGFSRGGAASDATRAEADLAVSRALALAPRLPSAHAVKAAIYQSRFQMPAAKKEYEKALSLAPDDPTALTAYANFVLSQRNIAKALRIADRLAAIDPLSGGPHALKAFILFVGRRYPEALAEEQRIAREWPDRVIPLLYAQILMKLGRDKEAPHWLARSDPASKIRLTLEAVLAARAGDVTGAEDKKARLEELYGEEASYSYAQIDAQLGRKDEAFAELDRAWALKQSVLGELWWSPWLDPIRSDPRYAALVRKVEVAS